MLHIELENIPKLVVEASDKFIALCTQIEADLNSGIVKTAAEYIPDGEPVREEAIAIIDTAIKAAQALKALGDDAGFKGRLLTLSTQLTNLETGGEHLWGDLIRWVQTVFNKKKA